MNYIIIQESINMTTVYRVKFLELCFIVVINGRAVISNINK